MANISLRAYRREIEDLIGHGRIDEVIAHCRHLLKFYPKDVAIYRLLAKAYLESQRYSDATDIFQRVLSVVPDDFVAHVGMSIIREDEGNMDASIWHMERAFESQPSNSAIRDELRRLFGKRDGMEPPKIRLTRGALARMYAQGNLYQQSIGELRAALADDPQRFDLQVLLARMYYMNGQRVEAAETSNALISKLPFCLDANRILAEILYDSDRASEAEVYHQRVKVIDPYAAHATPDNLSTEDVPEDRVTLMRLDWQPGQELSEMDSRPGWAASLGLDLGKQGSGTDELPDWLTDEEEDEADFMTEDNADQDLFSFGEEDTQPEEVPSPESPPEPSMDYRDTLPPEGAAPESAAAEADELIPDWMKDAGWATSTGEAPEQPPVFGEEDEPEGPVEEEAIASADIPDWLQDIAPAEAPKGGEPVIQADEEMSGEIPSWLSSRPPGPTDSVVMWLQNKPDEADLPPTTGDLETPEEPEEEVPDWLQSVAASLPAVPATPEASEVTDEFEDMPLRQTESHDAGDEDLADEAEELESGAIDWMAAVEAPAPDTIEDTKPRMVTQDLEEKGSELAESAFDDMEPSDLLGGGEDEDDLAGEITAVFIPDEDEFPSEEASEPAGMFDETMIAEPGYETEGQAEEAEDIPDWLREMEDEALASEPAMEQPHPEVGDEEALPDWLRGLESEPATEAFDQAEISEAEIESVEVDLPAADSLAEEDVPDWLLEMEASTPSVEAPSIGEIEQPPVFEADVPQFTEPDPGIAPPAEPVPDWLADDLTTRQPAVGDSLPSEAEDELETAFSGSLPSLDDQDAAIAWLESLAAKQGVSEEELVTDPEERRETPPAWVTDSMTGFDDFESVAEDEEVEFESVMDEPLPDQPDWMTETLIGDTLVADRDEVLEAAQGALEETGFEEPALEEPAIEEWSLDTLDKSPESELPGAEEVYPPETRQLEPEAFGLPPLPESIADDEVKETDFASERYLSSEGEAEEALDEPAFMSPGMTREFEADELPAPDWLTAAEPEEEPESEVPAWLDQMADELEDSGTTPQPAMTRELGLEEPEEPVLWEKEAEAAADLAETGEVDEFDEPEPEWMRDTGFPEAAQAMDAPEQEEESFEEDDAVPEWMRETGVPSTIFESDRPVEPQLETDSEAEEPEPEWMVETAFPSMEQEEDMQWKETAADAGAEPDTPEGTEDWMLETALPEELQAALEEQPQLPVVDAHDEPETTYAQPDPELQYQELLAEAQSALDNHEIADALGKYHRLIRRRRQLEPVIQHLQDATYQHPVDTDILETLGDAYVKANRLQDALDTYSRAEDLLRS